MSVVETNKIDGIGTSKRRGELLLLITDHLGWENEYEHLVVLQNKINAYLDFIESKQYLEIYPDSQFKKIVIEINFKNKITKKCDDFLKVVSNQTRQFNIEIQVEVD